MKIFDTRNEMVSALIPKNEIYAEIGVFKGHFSKFLLSCLAPQQLVLIDLFNGWIGSGDADGNNFERTNLIKEYNRLKSELSSEIVKFEKGNSSRVLEANYSDDYFTMIYIDGDHSYKGCKKDLEVAYKKVKPGGYIMGHDYSINNLKTQKTYKFGVFRAVEEFCNNYSLKVSSLGMDGCVSFAIQINK